MNAIYLSSRVKEQLSEFLTEEQIDNIENNPLFIRACEVAEGCKNYYEHKDFIGNYAYLLLLDRHACIDRIQQIVNRELDYNKPDIDRETAENIYDYIAENSEDFLDEFNSYWTGGMDVDSVSFGEQEEQISEIYGLEDIPQPFIEAAFEANDYTVIGNGYAYYDLSSSGVYIRLDLTKIAHLLP